MKLIAGLGNIGREYAGTRHNIGFMVADELAKRWGETTWKTGDNASYVEHRLPEKVFLIKPTTYMNLSGIAVGDFANFFGGQFAIFGQFAHFVGHHAKAFAVFSGACGLNGGVDRQDIGLKRYFVE